MSKGSGDGIQGRRHWGAAAGGDVSELGWRLGWPRWDLAPTLAESLVASMGGVGVAC